jgi:hypothetical protein
MTLEFETGGPWLSMAVFCEKVLEDKDGVLSAIRIVDRFFLTASGPAAPEKMPPTPFQFSALLAFKSGFARGSYTVRLRPRTPSNVPLPEQSVPILLEGEDRGAYVHMQLNMTIKEDGLYWFDVSLGESLVTRMPLRVVYQRLGTRPPTTG